MFEPQVLPHKFIPSEGSSTTSWLGSSTERVWGWGVKTTYRTHKIQPGVFDVDLKLKECKSIRHKDLILWLRFMISWSTSLQNNRINDSMCFSSARQNDSNICFHPPPPPKKNKQLPHLSHTPEKKNKKIHFPPTGNDNDDIQTWLLHHWEQDATEFGLFNRSCWIFFESSMASTYPRKHKKAVWNHRHFN